MDDKICRDTFTDSFVWESDTMTKYLVRERLDILWKYEVTTFEKCPHSCTSNKCKSCSSRSSVGNIGFYSWFYSFTFSTSSRFQNIGNIIIDFLIDTNISLDIFLDFEKFISFYWWIILRRYFIVFRFWEYFFLVERRWIIKKNLHKKSIELSFWKRICTFMFERILCSNDKKRRGKRKTLLANSHLTFLHSFEESWLDFRWSTIDLISKENMSEYRSFSHFEFPELRTKYLTSREIRGEKIWRKWYSLEVISEHVCECLHGLGLSKSGYSLYKDVSSCKEARYELANEVILPDNDTIHRWFEREDDIASRGKVWVHSFEDSQNENMRK